ncbi:sesquipedalian-1-like [Branchiostoma lanceolatum]|uniref:sesquipedalian-1-like n=1 Tax=Branchiostoma lanceolatum TaxID=7740 RepID=UPI003455A0EE
MKLNEKNVTAYATCASPIDKDGYLHKRGEVNRGFQRRYFLLKGNLLFYFDRKGDKEPVGVIVLEGCTVELSSDAIESDCPNVFEIVFQGPGTRTYVLMADNHDDMESWMKALQCANYDYKRLQVQELQRQLKELEDRGVRGDEGDLLNGAVGGWAPQPRVNPFDKDRFDPKRVPPKTGVNSRPRGPNRPPPPPPVRGPPPPPPIKPTPAPTTNQQPSGSSTFFTPLDTSSIKQNGNGGTSLNTSKAASTWYNAAIESSDRSNSAGASAWYTAVPQNISLTQSAPASTSLNKSAAKASPGASRHNVRSAGVAGSSLFYDTSGAKV